MQEKIGLASYMLDIGFKVCGRRIDTELIFGEVCIWINEPPNKGYSGWSILVLDQVDRPGIFSKCGGRIDIDDVYLYHGKRAI